MAKSQWGNGRVCFVLFPTFLWIDSMHPISPDYDNGRWCCTTQGAAHLTNLSWFESMSSSVSFHPIANVENISNISHWRCWTWAVMLRWMNWFMNKVQLFALHLNWLHNLNIPILSLTMGGFKCPIQIYSSAISSVFVLVSRILFVLFFVLFRHFFFLDATYL